MYKTTGTRGWSIIVKQIKTNYIFLISSVSGKSTRYKTTGTRGGSVIKTNKDKLYIFNIISKWKKHKVSNHRHT